MTATPATVATGPATAAPSDTTFFGHPRGLATLFFTELWERFSYYGMRALLILFMTAPVAAGGLAFPTAKAGAIYGGYTALVYLVSVPGGWIADRFLGQRRATLYGGVVIMLGHICLAVPSLTGFYLGLALVITGTGLLKPNISTMVGQLYPAEDHRRDAGFSIFYMGINLGAFLAPLATGWLAQSEQFRGILGSVGISPETSWHWGFGLAAVGMFLGLTQYLAGWKYLGMAGLEPVRSGDPGSAAADRKRLALGIVMLLGAGALLTALSRTGTIALSWELFSKGFGILLLAIVVVVFGGLFGSRQWAPRERKNLVVILVLFLASTVFWALYEQAGSTLNLFAERSTNTSLFGFRFPASWFQAVPALLVIVLAPTFAWLWVRLGDREPSSPAKFVFGLLGAGAGFAVLILPAHASAGGLRVSPLWLILTYLLHVMGEMCVSPVGLSATTKLAPARVGGLMMGVWFLSLSVGSYLGGRVASVYEAFALPELFGVMAACGLMAAVLLALLLKPMARLRGGS